MQQQMITILATAGWGHNVYKKTLQIPSEKFNIRQPMLDCLKKTNFDITNILAMGGNPVEFYVLDDKGVENGVCERYYMEDDGRTGFRSCRTFCKDGLVHGPEYEYAGNRIYARKFWINEKLQWDIKTLSEWYKRAAQMHAKTSILNQR